MPTPDKTTDPIIEHYKQRIDRTLLRANLRKSIDERVRSLGEEMETLGRDSGSTCEDDR